MQFWFYSRLQPSAIKLGTSAGSDGVFGSALGYETSGDNNGNVLTQQIKGSGLNVTQTYQYDGANRLSVASESGSAWSRNFDYDGQSNGWVSSSTGISPSNFTPQGSTWFNSNNQLVNDGLGIQHDDAGNQTAIGGYSFTFDAENRLATSTINSATTTNVYDGEGRRVKRVASDQTQTVYVYNAMGQLAAEYASNPPAVGGTIYLTADHLGSTRVATSATGTTLARRDYLPFGEEIASDIGGRTSLWSADMGAAQKFTGKERDTLADGTPNGLDYFGARYFSAAQGRFTTPDWSATPAPIPYADLRDPQTLNLYAYVRNNPLRLTDPDGDGFWTKLGNWLSAGGWNEDEEANRVRAEAAQRRFQREVAMARDYFAKTPTMINGQFVDPDMAGDREIVNAFYQAVPVLGDPFNFPSIASVPVEPGQLQAKFKHAQDFGVKGNWNKQTAAEFERAVQSHVDDPASQVIKGTYRGQPVIHHVNPQTGLNVMTDPAGKSYLDGSSVRSS